MPILTRQKSKRGIIFPETCAAVGRTRKSSRRFGNSLKLGNQRFRFRRLAKIKRLEYTMNNTNSVMQASVARSNSGT